MGRRRSSKASGGVEGAVVSCKYSCSSIRVVPSRASELGGEQEAPKPRVRFSSSYLYLVMFRFTAAARQAARSSRRAYSTAAPAPKKSDLPWAVG